ncbi:MAG: hypothetical protein FIB07_07255 [Candidatus Methanoperedens sp.]|nr:hypothetical protein [Candidatus Methanoperedens sp.]
MKISELIQEFVPCEICGNNDTKNFYFHVLVDKGSQPYVKCCECEEEYYSESARTVLTQVEESRKGRIVFKKTPETDFSNQESLHPLVKILAQM